MLNPGEQSRELHLLPTSRWTLQLNWFVPGHFHNVWTMVAFALVAATVLKGIFDYLGTYLVNYAGFGMITDLRNELYTATLRRSVAFFQKHTTGTLLSALINDMERVQYAMSTVLAEFLQQLFTLIFTACVVVLLGGKLAWVLVLFVPFVLGSVRRIGKRVRSTTRKGQDKLAEIQNILHETITGVRIVKAFSMEAWETRRFREAARRLFRANLRSVSAAAISSPMMDIFGAIAIALLILVGREQIKHHVFTEGVFLAFIVAVFKLYEPVRKFAQFNNNFQQALGASSAIFEFLDAADDVTEKPGAITMPPFHQGIRFEHVYFSYRDEEDHREVLHDINLRRCARRGGGDCRIKRIGQDDAGASAAALLRCDPRQAADRRPRRARPYRRFAALGDRHRHARHDLVQRHGAQQHRLRPAYGSARTKSKRPRVPRLPMTSSWACRTATTP